MSIAARITQWERSWGRRAKLNEYPFVLKLCALRWSQRLILMDILIGPSLPYSMAMSSAEEQKAFVVVNRKFP